MPTKKEVYDEWLNAAAALAVAKKKEITLRNIITKAILRDKLEGSVTDNDEPGYVVKATAKVTRKVVDANRLMACGNVMSDEEKSVFDWKWVPKINKANYDKHKSLFHVREQIIVKPAQATLQIEKVLENSEYECQEEYIYTPPQSEINPPPFQETTQNLSQSELNQGDHIRQESFLEEDITNYEQNSAKPPQRLDDSQITEPPKDQDMTDEDSDTNFDW